MGIGFFFLVSYCPRRYGKQPQQRGEALFHAILALFPNILFPIKEAADLLRAAFFIGFCSAFSVDDNETLPLMPNQAAGLGNLHNENRNKNQTQPQEIQFPGEYYQSKGDSYGGKQNQADQQQRGQASPVQRMIGEGTNLEKGVV